PVVITVPTGQDLRINLTNNLSFTLPDSSKNSIPTSLTIVGQLGGGLGKNATSTESPEHPVQTPTWPAASSEPGGPTNTPPTQGPRVQSFATEVAAGSTTSLTWTAPREGTYLLESGTHPSIQGPMGLYGMVVVTSPPANALSAFTAYQGVTYSADVKLLFSEIDPVQNNAVNAAVNTAGFSETKVWSGQPGHCGNPTSSDYQTCYPPAVNYSARYYLINGVGFNKTNPAASLFPSSPAVVPSPGGKTALVRMVNAGLRMHIPSIVGAQTGTVTPATSGFSLIAEDGNVLPGVRRVQTEVFMAPGKTYDVMVNVPVASGSATTPDALPIFDRALGLSGNATARDAGMIAYLGINGGTVPVSPAAPAVANPDVYNSVISGKTLTVSDPAKGVIANDVNVLGVKVVGTAPVGLTLNTDGTFVYTAGAPTSFMYCGNGATSGSACATVSLNAAALEAGSGITVNPDAYTSNLGRTLTIKSPGVLLNDSDAAGYPLTVSGATPTTPLTIAISGGGEVSVGSDGGFTATVPGPGTYTFSYKAKNSQGTDSTADATVTLTFPVPSGLQVTLVDGKSKAALDPQDYRWIVEEDRTWYQDPNCSTNPAPPGCPGSGTGVVPAYGTNFHTSHMPVIAQGCTGSNSCESGQTVLGVAAACDVGNGICRTDVSHKSAVLPSEVVLDPAKRYYISVLPGDAMDPGHAMGGAPIFFKNGAWQAVKVFVEPMPLPTATVSAFVFEDDFPMNGEDDTGGGVDVLAPNEPGLGGFNVVIYDNVGQFGDPAGQMTYDMFNQPVANALAGTIDPATGQDACPVSANSRNGFDGGTSPTGITGTITVCPKYEADGKTLSPLAGQVVVRNLPPGFYGVEAHPGADRIARGEEWLQTNTLDGGFAHDAFLKASEPSYFQEYGPAGFHVAIGFANPAIINNRKPGVCANRTDCTHTVTGKVTLAHMSRTPDERLYSTSTSDAYAFTQTYVSLGSPGGADFAFARTADDGTFTFTNMPGGDWRITVFDQWTDLILDGYTTPVRVDAPVVNMGDVAIHQWRQNLYTRTFFDQNGDGISEDSEPGLSLVPTNIRYRDGSYSNFNSTDLNGFAGFNEVFPIFNWYVVETDSTRYKNTGTHVVYDAGGPVDGSPACGRPGIPACGDSTIGKFLARTKEDNSLPADLRVPGSVYCDNADCLGFSIANGPGSSASSNLSTGRIDAPWVQSYGWQGFLGQAAFLEFGKKPFAKGENGGIRGHVVYASTRPFDDPALLLQLSWEPLVPNVTVNLYEEGTAPDGSTSLKLVDTTQTSSWDEWAQGLRSDGKPNMNCPGQSTSDPFYFTLFDQPELLNLGTALPYHSQYKCYDGMHNWNQLQPAPYNGMYQFPSVTARNPQTGKPTGTNCTVCTADSAAAPTDWDYGQPMLPPGKYVVEMIVPPGYELVKEEDKNILMGDAYEAPVTQQFAGFGNIFIMPDQAAVNASYNANNPLMPTTDEGAQPRHEGDTGSVEVFWPCVGTKRIVPDYMSLFPGSGQNAPFAGATRPLCDRKEVTLEDQMSVLAKFYVFTSTHVAGHYTGIITDDFTSEFDPFSPAFGEKFEPPYLPVSVKDWAGNEVSRVYADQWGIFNGLTYSSWGVNPPDPSGYVPQMFVMCMNDRGTDVTPDPLYQDSYSQFCYEWPMMPGETGYLDTPVIPNTAFAEGYNHPDCDYPDGTPAIASVTSSDIAGPWVSDSGTGHTLTIAAMGNQAVNNYGYSGPAASTAPFNQKTIMRHYGFGNTRGSVSVGGVKLTAAQILSWDDTQIRVTVPAGVPQCSMQQQEQYVPDGTSTARCGELVITTAAGKESIDTVTVTVGGKTPTLLTAGQTIQSAIDAAAPGDMIIVPPGTYKELLLMWKPVRLQGVGAVSTVINGDTQPAGVIDPWRHQVSCLFGLALNGQPYTGNGPNGGKNPYDPADGGLSCPGNGWKYFSSTPNVPQVDRIPFEGILGWDTTVNGNLAEMLQEPTLMGSYEGAGITVLAKGVRVPAGTDWFGVGAEAAYPDGTTLLTANDCGRNRPGDRRYVANPFPSNFQCNPSRIDGFLITNSSQGGGGILVHGWGHNIEISNNRVRNNSGTLSGGIEIGQGEFGDGYFKGDATTPAPGSCESGGPNGTQLPYCFNTHTKVHHNMVTLNSSTGDELFTSTPSGGGGVTFCIGSDYYKLNYNWICGNMSSGDGGGIAHLGFSYNGDISNNSILFNQSTNPTVPTSGGGLVVMGPAPDGQTIQNGVAVECGSVTDVDCVPGLSDGSGPGLNINANVFLGNAAESG
ncbi:MAG: Ig-like domain-containing protein, partial [Acidobacteriota bacterium]